MFNGNGKETYQQIREIKGNLYAGRIYFKTAETDEITVESVGTNEKLGFQAYEKGGVLYLQTKKIVIVKRDIRKGSITITIPQRQTFEKIKLFLKIAELDADRFYADKLEVNNAAGQMRIQDFSAAEARLECGAGAMSARGNTSKKIEVACNVGEVSLELKGRKNDYNYDLECGIGTIKCGNDQYSGIGRLMHLDNQASKQVKVACSIGQVSIGYAELSN